MIASTKTQIRIMFRKREFKAAMLVSLAYACVSFIFVARENWGLDASMIKDANQSVCYGVNNEFTSIFQMLLPFLIVIPYATSYIDDYKNQLLPVYVTRISRTSYYVSKLIACFVGTAMMVAIPFLISFLLANLFFPHSHDVWPGGYQDISFCEYVLGIGYQSDYPRIAFLELFLNHQVLYALLYLVIISLFAGVMGAFVLCLSYLFRKSRLLLFVPVYVMLQLVANLDGSFYSRSYLPGGNYVNVNIMEYVLPTLNHGLSPWYFLGFLLAVLAVMVCATAYGVKKDLRSIQ